MVVVVLNRMQRIVVCLITHPIYVGGGRGDRVEGGSMNRQDIEEKKERT